MSKIKLLIGTTYYPQFVNDFYLKNSGLTDAAYNVQFEELMKQGFGFGDVWKYELEQTGLFEVEIAVINIPQLQTKWAEENQIKFRGDHWVTDIFNAQAGMFQPDVLFAHDRILLTPDVIRKLKSNHPSIRKVISWDGIALRNTAWFSESDMILTCAQFTADYYLSKNVESHLFPFAFDKRILNEIKTGTEKYNVSFVGSLTLRKEGHHKRLKLLSGLNRKVRTDVWLSSFDEHRIYFMKQLLRLGMEGQWDAVTGATQLSRQNKGEAFGIEMYQILADSKITINSHIDTSYNTAGNSRLWEATGVGTCLVTDWKENLHELFKPDTEVVTYKSTAECIEKVQYLLTHPQERRRIAEAGHKRTMEEYNYASRLKKIIPILSSF